MPAGRPYPPETRARVVGEIMAGESIRGVAKRWGIPFATVEGWWREDRPIDVSSARTRERMVDQIYDTAYDCLEGVRAGARLLQDPTWARAQTAEGLATLVAALGERSIRMLGGLRSPEPEYPAITDGVVVDAAAGSADDGLHQ